MPESMQFDLDARLGWHDILFRIFKLRHYQLLRRNAKYNSTHRLSLFIYPLPRENFDRAQHVLVRIVAV